MLKRPAPVGPFRFTRFNYGMFDGERGAAGFLRQMGHAPCEWSYRLCWRFSSHARRGGGGGEVNPHKDHEHTASMKSGLGIALRGEGGEALRQAERRGWLFAKAMSMQHPFGYFMRMVQWTSRAPRRGWFCMLPAWKPRFDQGLCKHHGSVKKRRAAAGGAAGSIGTKTTSTPLQ